MTTPVDWTCAFCREAEATHFSEAWDGWLCDLCEREQAEEAANERGRLESWLDAHPGRTAADYLEQVIFGQPPRAMIPPDAVCECDGCRGRLR